MGNVRARSVAIYVAGLIAVVVTVAIVLWQPILLPLLIGGGVLFLISLRKPHVLAPLLLLAAVPLIRPGILSNHFALPGALMIVLAAFLSIVADRFTTQVARPFVFLAVGVAAIDVWLLVSASTFGNANVGNIGRDLITTALAVAAAGFVLASPQRRRIFAVGFIWTMVALGLSYIVTVVVWQFAGISAGTIGSFPIDPTAQTTGTVTFPFTITFGTVNIFNVTIPRLTGLGREPGWMALYAGAALLIAPRVIRLRWWMIIALAAAVLGTVSTAGFGALVVVLVGAWLTRPSGRDMFTRYIASILKLALLAGAIWVAIFAPIVGFAAKGDINQVSLSERSLATQAGLRAITEHPLGDAATTAQSGINLIAAIAPFGIPFFLIVTLAVLGPLLFRSARPALPVAVLVYVTLLLSQPATSSAFAFILVGLAFTLPASRPSFEGEQQEHAPQLSEPKLQNAGGRFG